MVNLLAPHVLAPLSECNTSVVVTNVIPGAIVALVVRRGGADIQVGANAVEGSKGTVTLDAGAQLVAGDLVNARQSVGADDSPISVDGPQVQTSVADVDDIQVLTRLYRCSRGFFLGGMRPGTHVEIRQGAVLIGSGDAPNGTAAVAVPDGLPAPGTALTARQVICPKPPPPPPGTAYVRSSALPATTELPYHAGQPLPAPAIATGLTACSRAVQVVNIQPGCDVILEAVNGAWWASLGPSDQTTAWVPLPVGLTEGELVSIRQEVGPRCELRPDPQVVAVGPTQRLGKPRLTQIDCNTTPSIYAVDLKPEATVEFSVTFNGAETIYRTAATEAIGPLPAPPMPAGAIVKVRHGECDVWSDWSDFQQANQLAAPPLEPRIPYKLFACQDAVPVENVFPLSGELRVMSSKYGEIARLPTPGNAPILTVAPSLRYPDTVWIEHSVCGYIERSAERDVNPSQELQPGAVQGPLFDGDTEVIMANTVAGARVELWDETTNVSLQSARAPFADTWFTNVRFNQFGSLRDGMSIYVKALNCGHYVRTPSVPVHYHAPVLGTIVPSSCTVGDPAFTLSARGQFFRPGARVQWNNVDRATAFVSDKELQIAVTAADVAAVKTVPIRVINPDGQSSGAFTFTVAAVAQAATGYDEVVIQNCNRNYIPNSWVHRPIHIYFRRTDLGVPQAWAPIWESPHNADYDEWGRCPASPDSGARFPLDDGHTYEVAVTDPLLVGCNSGAPDEPACLRWPVITIRGKAGGGSYTVRII